MAEKPYGTYDPKCLFPKCHCTRLCEFTAAKLFPQCRSVITKEVIST